MRERLPVILFAAIMAAIPFISRMPPFSIVLLDNIGLAALVAMGLVLLTGVGGLTSFGQAAFCGFGAYTTAVLTTAYGVSPWLTLPLSLLVSGPARGLPRPRPGAAVGPLFAARPHRLGPRPVLSVQQARIPRPQRRHLRHSAADHRRLPDDRSRADLLCNLDRGLALCAAHHEPSGLAHRPRHPRAAARPHRR